MRLQIASPVRAVNPQKLNPPFILFPKVVLVDGFNVIHIQVPESSQVHQTAGKVYDRSSDGDFVVRGAHQIAELYNRKRNHYTEGIIYPAFRFEDFKQSLFPKVRNLIRSYNANHPWLELNDEQMLKMAGLWDRDFKTGEEGYTLAAILLLGKDEAIRSVVPHFKVDALVRRVNVNRYDDRLYIQTNLIEAYEQLLEFVAKHLPDKFYLEGDQRRSLRTIIFREVAANILVHKEYTNAYPTTFVITRTAVVAENANIPNGEGPIAVDNFKPFPKNPTIAKFFMQIGRFDELGSGILNINKYCKAYSGHAHPEFIEGAVFKTIIPLDENLMDGDDAANDTLNGDDAANDTLNGDDAVNDTLNDAANDTLNGVDAVNDTLNDAANDTLNGVDAVNDRIKTVIEQWALIKYKKPVYEKLIKLSVLLYRQEGLKAEELAMTLQYKLQTVKRYLKILKEKEIIERPYAKKEGGYYLTQLFKKEIENNKI
jgi:ATP-dependent DNA helicase RecG